MCRAEAAQGSDQDLCVAESVIDGGDDDPESRGIRMSSLAAMTDCPVTATSVTMRGEL
jgi:hypothetical protein